VEPLWNALLSHFQTEAMIGLKSLYNAERLYYESNGEWADHYSGVDVGFSDDSKYAFFLAPDQYEGRALAELGLTIPVDFTALGIPVPGVTDQGFVAVAIGNIDLDNNLDVWWIDHDNNLTNSNPDLWRTWKELLKITGDGESDDDRT
jgi:hypothetical protein